MIGAQGVPRAVLPRGWHPTASPRYRIWVLRKGALSAVHSALSNVLTHDGDKSETRPFHGIGQMTLLQHPVLAVERRGYRLPR